MSTANLFRVAEGPDGTAGFFILDNLQLATIERRADDDHPRIPAGTYTCKRTMFMHGGYETFEITGVPNRIRILIHIANFREDLEGCVGIGLALGFVARSGQTRKQLAAIASKEAFSAFRNKFAGVNEFTLVITDPGKN